METEESSEWQEEDQGRVTGLSENNGFKGEKVAAGAKPAEPSREIRTCSFFFFLNHCGSFWNLFYSRVFTDQNI